MTATTATRRPTVMSAPLLVALAIRATGDRCASHVPANAAATHRARPGQRRWRLPRPLLSLKSRSVRSAALESFLQVAQIRRHLLRAEGREAVRAACRPLAPEVSWIVSDRAPPSRVRGCLARFP